MAQPTTTNDVTLPDDIVFGEATDHQRTLSWKHSQASMSASIPVEQYVDYKKTMSETEHSANRATRYFILTLKDDPNSIVAGCELMTKKGLISDSTGTRMVDLYGVSYVYTVPEYRGKRMASRMLRKLQKLVDNENTECSVLFSGIGRKFYRKLGWLDFPSPQLVFNLDPGYLSTTEDNQNDDSHGIRLLAETDIPELCDKDIHLLKEKFRRLAETQDGKTYVAFLPTTAQSSWHFTRDSCIAKAVGNGQEPQYRGAQTSDGRSWLFWDHDLLEKSLRVQRIVTNPADGREKREADIKELFGAAVREAREWGLPRLVVWNPYEEVSGAAVDVWRESKGKVNLVFEEREGGAIPSLRWKGGDESRVTVWDDLEYFCWC